MNVKRRISKESVLAAKSALFASYNERYFNLWLNSWKWDGLSRDQREFVMRKLWADGQIAAFEIINPSARFMDGLAPDKALVDKDTAFLGFAPFAPIGFNMYNYPVRVNLINERGTPFIPTELLVNGENVVLGYAQHSRQPVRNIVDGYIARIVDVEMTIRTNLIAQKIPVVIEVSKDSQLHAEELQSQILGDEPLIFTNVKEVDALKSAMSGVPFAIDKLYQYKIDLENELNTFLGIENHGNVRKKERENDSEIEISSAITDLYKDSIKSNLEEFCALIKDILGYSITLREPEPSEEPEDDEEKESEVKEDETKRM